MPLFFFNDTATTEIYTLSHTTLFRSHERACGDADLRLRQERQPQERGDRKSTRLNSSHANISYAVFCLKKKKIYALHSQLVPSANAIPFSENPPFGI